MNEIKHEQIFKQLETWAPKHLAYDWDNVGLQVGSSKAITKKVMVTLDVVESVVDEAIEQNVNLIIAHHPLIFQPLKQIDFHSMKGKIIRKLIEHDITVYAAHTNLDIAEGGVNDLLLDKLPVKNRRPFIPTHQEKLLKLVVFVPISHVDAVRDALSKAGAGHIGNYSHCTFQSKGNGTFMPLEGTNPYIGDKGKLEIVDEMKIETIVKEKEIQKVVSAMKNAHPYEEVAYDLYPLENAGEKLGLGRVAILEEPVTLQKFAEMVKDAFKVDGIRITGDLHKEINKIAIVGGSGQSYMEQAVKQGVDAFITGDVTFHTALDAKEMGLAIIDPGHFIEKVMIDATKQYLTSTVANLDIVVTETNSDPFKFM